MSDQPLRDAAQRLADEAQKVINEAFREDIDFNRLHRARVAVHRLLDEPHPEDEYHTYTTSDGRTHCRCMVINVERLARAFPKVLSQEECDSIYGPGNNPLDEPVEWYDTPREIATAIVATYDEGD